MLKTLRYRFILTLLAGIFTGAFVSAQTNDDRIGSPIPAFSFPDMNGNNVTQYHFKAGQPTIVIYFDPGCDHCQELGHMINEEWDKFNNINLMFVAFSEIDAIKEYKTLIFGDKWRSYLYFCADPKYSFDKVFGYSQAPTIHIYDKSGKKVKVFRNEVAPSEMLKFAQ